MDDERAVCAARPEDKLEGMSLGNVDILRLATARTAELVACEAGIGITTARAITQLQRLPVRLRRRAASHHPRRLPRRLHQQSSASKNLLDKAKQIVTAKNAGKSLKQPTRRFRRRGQRLEALAARRCLAPTSTNLKSAPKWVPTHLWHAKRFHMVENWGWRIPYAPTDKLFKTCQRATTDRCLMLDHGYMSCFQLTGPLGLIKACLASLTLPYSVSAINVSQYPEPPKGCRGFRETVNLFCVSPPSMDEEEETRVTGRLPNITRPILGPVRILWGPNRNQPDELVSQIWLWFHPCMHTEAWNLLTSLVTVKTSTDSVDHSNGEVCYLSDCTGHLCRLKLIGPFAHQVLGDILTVPPLSGSVEEALGNWSLWNTLKEYKQACLFPQGCSVGLICDTFLKNRPKLKLYNRNWLVSAPNEANTTSGKPLISQPLTESSFLMLSETGTPDFDSRIIAMMSTQTVLSLPADRIPILLVQNSNPSLSVTRPQCVGWDVILPRLFCSPPPTSETTPMTSSISTSESTLSSKGDPITSASAKDLLIACVYRGVRVGGLREQLRWAGLTSDAGGRIDAFPYLLWPDTPAGHQISQGLHLNIKRDRNGLTGDARRRARSKFRTSVPTSVDWRKLIDTSLCLPPSIRIDAKQEKEEEVVDEAKSSFFVLRDKALLVLVVRRLLAGDARARLTIGHLTRYHPLLPRALVLVRLEVLGRGVPEPRSILYLPRSADDVEKSRNGALHMIPPPCPPLPPVGFVDEGAYAFSHGVGLGMGFVSMAALVVAIKAANNTSLQPNCLLFKTPASSQLYTARISVVL